MKVYSTEIKGLGSEAGEFLDAGMVILFQAGAPPELAEMSVLHEPRACRETSPSPGDVLCVDTTKVRITAIGEKAWQNMRSMGHAVLKFNGEKAPELPGDICLEKLDGEKLAEVFRPGVKLEIDEETR